MVGLSRNRKGMVAVFDAMIFIVLLSAAATWLFMYTELTDNEEPMAKTVSDDLFAVELRTCDLLPLGDTKVLPLSTIIAASMNSGDQDKVERFVFDTLKQLIPEIYGFEFTLEYNGHVIHLERTSDRGLSSEYSQDHIIDGAGTLRSTLKLF